MRVRLASHKGSWYSEDRNMLREELGKHLKSAERKAKNLKAIICPHAGYAYSAPTAAWSYKQIDANQNIKTMFILGPSHHFFLSKCGLPEKDVYAYETPLGNLLLNLTIIENLRKTHLFENIRLNDDEDEHSLEMQLPFIKTVFLNKNEEEITIVPIIVGEMSLALQSDYVDLFLPYFENPENLFVISSDFCHWGKRFSYTYVPPECANIPIHEAIEKLDKEAILYIEKHDIEGFAAYLSRTRNTICGQNPIKLFLRLVEKCGGMNLTTKLLHYKQSSAARNASFDSSVSYAAFMTTYN